MIMMRTIYFFFRGLILGTAILAAQVPDPTPAPFMATSHGATVSIPQATPSGTLALAVDASGVEDRITVGVYSGVLAAVTLRTPGPATPVAISLTSGFPDQITMPGSVTIAAPSLSASFTVVAQGFDAGEAIILTARGPSNVLTQRVIFQ